MKTYQHALNLLNGRDSRKVAHNTYARKLENGDIAIKLYATDVLVFHTNGAVTVNSGGYRTGTTKDRINSFLPAGLPRLYQAKGVWNWGSGVPFSEGDKIGPRGTLKVNSASLKKKKAEESEAAKLTKRINKFAKLCADSLPLPEPSGGDCWYCVMRTTEGIPLGEKAKDTGHLISHMEEGYVVPSLVYRALEKSGAGPLIVSAAFGKVPSFVDTARGYVLRSVRRYLKAQFGLAGGSYRANPAESGFAVR